jgi:putative two-component system response regulator
LAGFILAFEVPVLRSKVRAFNDITSHTSPGHHPSATVLVADDMEHNRQLLASILRSEGYRVVLAADGDEALELLATGSIEIALLDIMMPGRNGMSVCREIRSRKETRLLPVLLITGLNSTEDRIQGIECGADDFLTKPIMKEELMARVRSLLKIKQFTDDMEHVELVLFGLALSLEARNPYMEGHCERVSRYAVALGQRLGLPNDQLVALRRGGLVQNLGTIEISDRILQKAGPLDDDEWAQIKRHPEIGERICKPLRSFALVLPIIRHHHERLDGSGYPDGLKNGAIPLTAQVLSIVSIYDALTCNRPYRKAYSPENALGIIADEVKRGWLDGSLALELQTLIQETTPSSPISEGEAALQYQWG